MSCSSMAAMLLPELDGFSVKDGVEGVGRNALKSHLRSVIKYTSLHVGPAPQPWRNQQAPRHSLKRAVTGSPQLKDNVAIMPTPYTCTTKPC